MSRKKKCRDILIWTYGIIISFYFVIAMPFQIRTLLEVEKDLERQKAYYNHRIHLQKKYPNQLILQDYLELENKGFEKVFFNYQYGHEGTKLLLDFLQGYPISNRQVEYEYGQEQTYTNFLLKKEVYRITFNGTFYDAYEVLQDLLKYTGASEIYSVMMTDLNNEIGRTEIIFALNVRKNLDEVV